MPTDRGVEGLIIACAIMALSGYFGPQIWHMPMADLIGQPSILGDKSILDIWIPFLVIVLFSAHIPACIYNVVKARRSQNLPIAPVFLELTPFLIFVCSIGAWLYSPYSTLMRENRLMLFCLTMSFVFGRLTTKIILAHLTRQPFPYWTVMLIPLIGGAIIGNLPHFGLPPIRATMELWYLRGYFVFAVVAYFRWAILVIDSICAYLDINCLTITKRLLPKDAKQDEKNAPKTPRRSERISANGGVAHKGD